MPNNIYLLQVRYIIDYYDGDLDPGSHRFAQLDVRPAIDSFEALADRVKVRDELKVSFESEMDKGLLTSHNCHGGGANPILNPWKKSSQIPFFIFIMNKEW